LLGEVIEKKRKTLQQKYQGNGIKTDNDDDDDLLTLMLKGEFTGEGVLTNEEIASNLNVFFLGKNIRIDLLDLYILDSPFFLYIAGHDTTANALSFAIYALARDPVIQQKAREEAIRVLGDEPHDVLPTLEDIKQFDYINQVIKETLRVNGPATSGLPRVVSKDTEVSGVFLPKGTPIVVNIYDLHHNPRVWNDPETFDPSRFAYGGEADQKSSAGDGGSMSWSPFYNGQRMCIGMQFSLEEQRVMLSCLCMYNENLSCHKLYSFFNSYFFLVRKYEWRLPENSIHKDEVITETVGLLTAKNLEIIFKRRY
jgi:cytochrome P450